MQEQILQAIVALPLALLQAYGQALQAHPFATMAITVLAIALLATRTGKRRK